MKLGNNDHLVVGIRSHIGKGYVTTGGNYSGHPYVPVPTYQMASRSYHFLQSLNFGGKHVLQMTS